MYDSYARYIYDWLVNNRIADKMTTIVDSLNILKTRTMYLFIVAFFILVVIVCFKFITIRGRNL